MATATGLGHSLSLSRTAGHDAYTRPSFSPALFGLSASPPVHLCVGGAHGCGAWGGAAAGERGPIPAQAIPTRRQIAHASTDEPTPGQPGAALRLPRTARIPTPPPGRPCTSASRDHSRRGRSWSACRRSRATTACPCPASSSTASGACHGRRGARAGSGGQW